MSANRKGLSVTERHVLRSVVIAVLFVLSGVLGHIPASVPYVKTLMEWAGYSIVLLLLSEWMIRIFLRVRQRSICPSPGATSDSSDQSRGRCIGCCGRGHPMSAKPFV